MLNLPVVHTFKVKDLELPGRTGETIARQMVTMLDHECIGLDLLFGFNDHKTLFHVYMERGLSSNDAACREALVLGLAATLTGKTEFLKELPAYR